MGLTTIYSPDHVRHNPQVEMADGKLVPAVGLPEYTFGSCTLSKSEQCVEQNCRLLLTRTCGNPRN